MLLNICSFVRLRLTAQWLVAQQKRNRNSNHHLVGVRMLSAWCTPEQSESSYFRQPKFSVCQEEGRELEKLFMGDEVQELLTALNKMDLEKQHRWRRVQYRDRRHYALMTDKMHTEFLESLRRRAEPFLQLVPFKEPRCNQIEVLTVDPEINGFDASNIVFTDVSHYAADSNQDRAVVIREPNGTLRVALPEEHDRMCRVYYPKEDIPVNEPPLFSDPFLMDALRRNEHEFVLDWACYFFQPDDPRFVQICKQIFDRIIRDEKWDLLYGTRHFGTVAFYTLINGRTEELLNYFSAKQCTSGMANTIRLYKVLFPNWKTIVGSHVSDLDVIKNFDFPTTAGESVTGGVGTTE